ncbi:short-chain dehydrogenase/reductase [Streptomyces sp. CA-181903]|uniref:short-chain dehydrogenase/reductase n=1 Tax=Streptomyces sp. CA-181903 TaxID=3240055 RepID=UPI003D89C00B
MSSPQPPGRPVPARWRHALAGRTVVVTGAARGLGALLALRLSACGARVALVGLEEERLGTVAGRCPGPAHHWAADVTDGPALTAVARQVTERFGGVDAVVANAGIAVHGRLTDIEPDVFARVIEVNLLGSAHTARAFLPALLAARGHLLQITSVAALAPFPLLTAYGASKAGAEALALALRAETAHRGVTVGVAYMSWTDTDLVRAADEYAPLRAMRRSFPPPFDRIHPPEAVVDRLVAGLVRRSPYVYGQRWARGVRLVRPLVASVTAHAGPRLMRRMDPAFAASRDTVLRPLGGGGEAAWPG